MSDRSYYTPEITPEEAIELEKNKKLIELGKLPHRKRYYDKEEYCRFYQYWPERFEELKKDVEKTLHSTNPMDLLSDEEWHEYCTQERRKKVEARVEEVKKQQYLIAEQRRKQCSNDKCTPSHTPKTESDSPFKLWCIPLILIALFFMSIFDLPYGFYTFLRIAVCLLSLWFAFMCYIYDGHITFIILNILIAILWNPVIPVYLAKETWVTLDMIAIVIEVVITIYAYRLCEKS